MRPSKGSVLRSPLASMFFIGVGLLFWWGIYRGSVWLCTNSLAIEDVGELLLRKILSMAFLTFFSILIFSNLVTAFSLYFLSDDLSLLNSVPVRPASFFAARFLETLFHASWMVLIFGLPFLLAYGKAFGASWRYYLSIALVMVPFAVIPSALAVFISIILAAVFPAKKIRDFLLFLFVIAFVGIYLYFRLLRPERFLNPEEFTEAIQFLGMLKSPSSPLLPSEWGVMVLFPLLKSRGWTFFERPEPLLALFLGAVSLYIISYWTFEWLYREAYSRSQEGRKAGKQNSAWWNLSLWFLVRPFSHPTGNIIEKEFRTFFRSPGQWAQLLLLSALVIVYVFNFSSMRQISQLQIYGIPAVFAELGLYLLNLILLGFIVSAVAVRFAFPAVSLEGRAFWIIRHAPIPMDKFLKAKFWSIFIPLTIFSEVIGTVTNFFIGADGFLLLLSFISIFLISYGITALGIGLGAIYPRFEVDNPAQIATSAGGVLYMIASIGWVALIIAAQLLPLRYLFWYKVRGRPLSPLHLFFIVAVFSIIAILSIALHRYSIAKGARSLQKLA